MVEGEIADNNKKEYKGKLNVRIASETHQYLAELAASRRQSLNSVIKDILGEYCAKSQDK